MMEGAAECCSTLGGDDAFGAFQMRRYRSVSQTTQIKRISQKHDAREATHQHLAEVPTVSRSMKNLHRRYHEHLAFIMEQDIKCSLGQSLRTRIISVCVITSYIRPCGGFTRTRQTD